MKCNMDCFNCIYDDCIRESDEYMYRYTHSDKGKATARNYRQSEKGQEVVRKYNHSDKRKAAAYRYNHSEKGKEARRKYKQKLLLSKAN